MEKPISLTLPSDLQAKLDAEASAQDRSRSAMIRRILADRLQPHEYGGEGIHFETHIRPHTAIDEAVAHLGSLPPESFAIGAKPPAAELARWRARPYESLLAFQNRIRDELLHQGARGVVVSIYQTNAFWMRNVFGTLLPDCES